MSWGAHDPRLSVAELMAAAGLEPAAAHDGTHRDRDGWSDYNEPVRRPRPEPGHRSWERIAEQLGTTSRTLHRCVPTGLSPALADRCATALGLHPANIWPEWYAVAEDHAPRRKESHAA